MPFHAYKLVLPVAVQVPAAERQNEFVRASPAARRIDDHHPVHSSGEMPGIRRRVAMVRVQSLTGGRDVVGAQFAWGHR